jgi:orotidine-5'-phosphate decarboxylase
MKLVVALDLPTPEENLDLVRKLSTDGNILDIAYKVGFNTFVAAGPKFIEDLKTISARYDDALQHPKPEICLDLKLYDIPNTMASTAERITELGVDLITIHASAGEQGMRAVVDALKNIENSPKVLAVTVLTSFTHEHCLRVYKEGRTNTTQSLAAEAITAGVDGIVCSSNDLETIRDIQDSLKPRPSIIKFVPGIELQPRDDDQKRKGTLKDVIQGGADYIVVGRPIYKDDNPCDVVSKILEKIKIMEESWATFNETANW